MITQDTPRRWWIATVYFAVCCAMFHWPAVAAQIDPDELIDLDLKSAPLAQTLQSFAQISGSQLDFDATGSDPAVNGTVTAAFKATPWRQVLGSICLDHALNCEILSGEPPVLRVRSTASATGAAAQPGYAEGIDMSLKKADLRETLQVFGVIAGREVIVDEGVTGTVTIELKAAPWTVVLEEICNLSGCRVEWSETVLRIYPTADDAATRRASTSFSQTSLADVFETLAALPIFGPLGQPEVTLDETVKGSLTLELTDASWLDALNAICQQAGCRWQLTYGAPSRIAVRPIDPGPDQQVTLPTEPMTFGDAAAILARAQELAIDLQPGLDPSAEVRFKTTEAPWHEAAGNLCKQAGCRWAIHQGQLTFRPRYKTLTRRPPAGAEDRRVAVRFFAPTASEPVTAVAHFNWTSPIHTFKPAGDDRWLARLSWIPFGPELHLLVPAILHCGEKGQTAELLESMQLPLGEPETRQWRGAILELATPVGDALATGGTSGGEDCAPDSGRIHVTLKRDGSDGLGSSELDLPTKVGTYLVITPPGNTRRPAPIAALLALGRDDSGRGRVALVRPNLDGPGAELDLRTLPRNRVLNERLETEDGRVFDLALRFVAD